MRLAPVLLVFAVASPSFAGLLRTANIDLTIQGYGTASTALLPGVENQGSFVGSTTGSSVTG